LHGTQEEEDIQEGSGAPEGCEGSSIKGDMFYNGRVKFAKEQWHVSYVISSITTATTKIEDRWVGFKTMIWNTIRAVEDLWKWIFGWIRI
jgi:hypothetical protein